jgi:preprotein translocase subunit SecF
MLSLLVLGSGILGAVTLREFALALLIGIITGSYSSIFVASPLVAVFKEREPRYRSTARAARHRRRARAAGAGRVAEGRRERPPGQARSRRSVKHAAHAEAAAHAHPRPRKKKRRVLSGRGTLYAHGDQRTSGSRDSSATSPTYPQPG